MSAKYWVVIPAAGVGNRMETDIPKQYLKIRGKTVLEHTIEKFINHPEIEGVVVVLAADDQYWHELELTPNKKIMQAEGGLERCHSVLNGLKCLSGIADQNDWVLVHDAARPCVRSEDINQLMNELKEHAVGGILALPVRDTMKRVDAKNEITGTVEREGLWHALTPQMFKIATLENALNNVMQNKKLVTDDAQAIELFGLQPKLVQGHPDNIKITHQRDLSLAELFLSQQESFH